MYKQNPQFCYTNLNIVLSVLPLCTTAINLGRAGIVDFSVYFINTSLQKQVKEIDKHHQETKQDTCPNAYTANTSVIT